MNLKPGRTHVDVSNRTKIFNIIILLLTDIFYSTLKNLGIKLFHEYDYKIYTHTYVFCQNQLFHKYNLIIVSKLYINICIYIINN